MDVILSLGREAGMAALRLMLVVGLMDKLPMTIDDDFVPDFVYDFVVVGSGGAGSVVAARLSETGAMVLVLEAGSTAPPESAVPGLIGVQFGQENDYALRTESQQNTQLGYEQNSSVLPLGYAIGGSTTMNGMHYVRGNRRDYDHWARLGNPGWDYDSVLPYFKKSEDFKGFQTVETDDYHGQGGPLGVRLSDYSNPVSKAFFKAGEELGFKMIDDSGPSQIGFSPAHFTIRDGIRASTSEAFLRPNLHRTNLHIRSNALVTKIMFNADRRAQGVIYEYQGETREVRVKKEVIVCGGTIMTPKLLMLSGVGPADHLQEMGIPLVAAVEGVGQNFQDHPTGYALVWQVARKAAMKVTHFFQPFQFLEYITKQTGFYANPYHASGFAWIHLGDNDDEHEWPDSSFVASPITQATDLGVYSSRITHLKEELFKDIFLPLMGKEGMTIHVFLGRPKSRGWVKLRSTDPKDTPRVNHNFFDHPDDLKLLIRGVRFAFKIAGTRAYREELDAAFRSNPLRGCKQHVFQSDAYWECYLRHMSVSGWHPAGSCKMAPRSDPMGVVSPRLRLRGVSGVRIVDASIMPQVVMANTMATAIMIGEKGADLIKEDWGYPTDPL